jgi:hypothetical protein
MRNLAYGRKYIIVRSKLAFMHDNVTLVPIIQKLDSPVYSLNLNGELTWRDGAVIKFHSRESSREIGSRLSSDLQQFEMWSIHDAIADYNEPFGGLLEGYFRNSGKPDLESVQIFVKYKRDNADQDEIKAAIEKEVREPLRRVFHFRSGCILMLQSKQPFNILARRFEGQKLRPHVHSAAVNLGDETTFGLASASSWQRLV